MTDEQQNQLLESVKNILGKHTEVGEAFKNKSGEDEIISKIEDFFNSFNQLQQVYSELTNEEVQKHDKTSWNDLFSAMDRFN